MIDPSPLFLIGFMAAGKSTVGRLVAKRAGRRFVDLDEEVERRAKKSVAEIFRSEGEPGFRWREAEALAALAVMPGLVVACGGGAPCHGDNLTRMRRSGVVIALDASLAELLRRAALPGAPERPLLPDAERLYADRRAVYGGADMVVRTDGRTPETLAAQVLELTERRLGSIAVRLGERSYPIHIAPLARARELLDDLIRPTVTRVAVITDENVQRAGHPAALGLGDVPVLTVPPGEPSKSLAEVARLASACVAAGLDRRSAIVAVGGGVVGDLAGFVASVLYRGIAFAQVPTTLLAMVDSAIGGKTAVDLPEGKNLVGAFWQPRFVLADPHTLTTLPRSERQAAFGEVLKYGLLGDPELFADVEARGDAVDLADVVLRCARKKAEIVGADEREQSDQRALLNLGHTVGHAIEAASSGLHGACVALGLVATARVSDRLGVVEEGGPLEPRVAAAVQRVGLDADLDRWLTDKVLGYLAVDKKRAGGKLRFIALEAIGRPRIVETTPADLGHILRRV